MRLNNATRSAIAAWDQRLADAASAGKKTVIWGASSKGVAFLTSLEAGATVEYAVDINPFKRGKFLPGAGQQIVGPEFLKDYDPDLVVVMNSIYLDEIRGDLAKLGLNPEMLAV